MKLRKSIKFLVVPLAILLLFTGVFETNAAHNNLENASFIEIPEMTLSLNQLTDGISILITQNNDGSYSQEVFDDLSQIAVPTATEDGVLEWAVFHLGLKDWTSSSNCLYYTLSADEFIKTISRTAYVRPTNLLINDYYYNKSLPSEVYSSNTSRVLQYNIDVEGDTKVVVGYKNVVIRTMSGGTGSFTNSQKTVSR